MLGVNRGGLGFLTDIPPDELEARVGEVLAGKYMVETRLPTPLCAVARSNWAPVKR